MKTAFEDGNLVTRVPGTRVLAAWLNKVFNHRHDGKNEDGSAPLDYAVDTGAANQIAVALVPALTEHIEGLPLHVKVGNLNTGAVTIAVNGMAPVPVKKNVNEALVAGDIRVGEIVSLIYNGAHYQLMTNLTRGQADALYATKAQGTTADAAMPLAGFYIADNEITAKVLLTAPDEWTPWDLAVHIPAGYRYAIVLVECYLNGPDTSYKPRIRFRPSGTAGEGQVVASPWAAGSGDKVGTSNQVFVPVGEARSIDYRFESPPGGATITFRLQGYIQ